MNSDRDNTVRNARSLAAHDRYYVGSEDLDSYGVGETFLTMATCGYLRQQPRIGPLSRGRWVWEPYWDGLGFLEPWVGHVSLRTLVHVEIRGRGGPVRPTGIAAIPSSLAPAMFRSLDRQWSVPDSRSVVDSDRWWLPSGRVTATIPGGVDIVAF